MLLSGSKAGKSPYTVLAPQLTALLGGRERDREKQNLFITEGSHLQHYMRQPSASDAASLSFGDIPALDALCFALFALVDDHDRASRAQRHPIQLQAEPYCPLTGYRK